MNQQDKVIRKQDNHFPTDCIGNEAICVVSEKKNGKETKKRSILIKTLVIFSLQENRIKHCFLSRANVSK